ncbi:hypothetical protein [Nocardia transvalensis]|uniref:hypothetical protein n=1 Tax=Nocardia transvalensis TaxID=37333 RepID=UPI001893BAD7|nr:hypothetical protein [Nocardia transvalensis]MBF6329950.1 hypothetical protein [Nocardia transvalensis]
MRKLTIAIGLAGALTLSGAAVAQASPPGPEPDWSTKSPACQALHEPLYQFMMNNPPALWPLNIPVTVLLNVVCA